MEKSDVKSSMVAGVLGVFLGWVGGHDWYLGNSKKAITHVSLSVGGLIVLMVGVILDSLLKNVSMLNILPICLIVMAYVIFIGNLVWGMIEGVMILAQGDAGLAAKGYKVAESVAPLTMANPNENPNNANMAAPSMVAGGNTVNANAGIEGATSAAENTGAGVGAVNDMGSVTQATVSGVGQNGVMPEMKPVEGAGVATTTTEMPPVAVDQNTQADTTVPVGAAVQGGIEKQATAEGTMDGQTEEKKEDEVTLVERSALPPAPSDKEIADAVAAVVSQANDALGKQ